MDPLRELVAHPLGDAVTASYDDVGAQDLAGLEAQQVQGEAGGQPFIGSLDASA